MTLRKNFNIRRSTTTTATTDVIPPRDYSGYFIYFLCYGILSLVPRIKKNLVSDKNHIIINITFDFPPPPPPPPPRPQSRYRCRPPSLPQRLPPPPTCDIWSLGKTSVVCYNAVERWWWWWFIVVVFSTVFPNFSPKKAIRKKFLKKKTVKNYVS